MSGIKYDSKNDCYEILNVEPNASQEEIEEVYKALIKIYHPDSTKLNKKEAEEKSKKINVAYEILSNEKKRKKYDEERNRYKATVGAIKDDGPGPTGPPPKSGPGTVHGGFPPGGTGTGPTTPSMPSIDFNKLVVGLKIGLAVAIGYIVFALIALFVDFLLQTYIPLLIGGFVSLLLWLRAEDFKKDKPTLRFIRLLVITYLASLLISWVVVSDPLRLWTPIMNNTKTSYSKLVSSSNPQEKFQQKQAGKASQNIKESAKKLNSTPTVSSGEKPEESVGKNGLSLSIKGIEFEGDNTKINVIFSNPTGDPQIIPAQNPTKSMTETSSSITPTRVVMDGIRYEVVEGSFPLELKNAKVIIYKNGYTHNTSNIELLPKESYEGYLLFSKKLEKEFTLYYPLFEPITYEKS